MAETVVAVHHLPCKITHTGPANVAAYFVVAEREGQGSQLLCAFRGRRLVGTRVAVPDGACGLVLRKCADDATAESNTPAEHRWQAEPFSSLAWWGADFPAAAGAMYTAAAWLETAVAIHDEPAAVQVPLAEVVAQA
ncbi:hypothetical protein T492DRAFT_981079 [Pavlovales sp. CCMP2436]|nr:hypothetical protein T492DRAFT_981079 [Pavlovales sp. CCMP2436]